MYLVLLSFLVVFMIAFLAVKIGLTKSVTSVMASVLKISCGPAKGRKSNAFTNHLSVMVMNNVSACQHRFTNRTICAVPCDGNDDMCLNSTDEICLDQVLVISS